MSGANIEILKIDKWARANTAASGLPTSPGLLPVKS